MRAFESPQGRLSYLEAVFAAVRHAPGLLRVGDPLAAGSDELGCGKKGGYAMSFLFRPNVDKLKERRDVEGLIKALGYQRNEEVRRQAAVALGDIHSSFAVQPLINLLSTDPSWHVRSAAAGALGRCLDVRAVEPLIAALAKDESFDVRAVAAWSLGSLRDPRAVEPLIAALQDPSVRKQAAGALRWLRDARAVEPLVALLQDESAIGLGDRADWVSDALGWLRDARAIEPLIQALGSRRWERRAGAAKALGAFEDARVEEPLLALLKDEHSSVVWAAEEALGKVGGPRAVAPLIQIMINPGTNPEERELCKTALERIAEAHPEEKIPALIRAAEGLPESKGEEAAAARPATGAGHRYLGGLGEPYCSEACFARGVQYAMAEVRGAHCGVCGRAVTSIGGQRNYAVIPYDGQALVVCPVCAPGMREKLRQHGRCCVCGKVL